MALPGTVRRFFVEMAKRANRGNVTVLFTAAIIPLMLAVGSAIDYSQAARSRSHLSAASDAAALAAARAAQHYMNAHGTGPTQFQTASALALTAMNEVFAANQENDEYTQSATATLVMSQLPDGSAVAAVTADGDAPTSFMRLAGIRTIDVKAISEAKGGGGTYYQVIFLVDVSNSMGIGGTSADITKLKDNKLIKCAFACHDANNQQSEKITEYCGSNSGNYFCQQNPFSYCPHRPCAMVASPYSDKRRIAREAGIKLKIDYVNDAIGNFVTKLKPQMDKAPQYYSVGIQTFATIYNETQAVTSDPVILQSAADKVDLEIANTLADNYGYTFTTVGLESALAKIANVGDGTTPTKRKTYLIFLTDGIQNRPGWMHSRRKTDLDYASTCTTVKAAGIRIFSILAPYPYIPNDGQYSTLVAPLVPALDPTLRGCATADDHYFLASDGPGINAAVDNVFSNIFGSGSLRLSR